MDRQTDTAQVQVLSCAFAAKNRNVSYSDALLTLKMKSLKDRREELSVRNSEKFLVEKYGSDRYRNSALPFMKRLLNKHQLEKSALFKVFSVPMNHGVSTSISL